MFVPFIEEGWGQKQRQRSSRRFGWQNLFNFLPRYLFSLGLFGRIGWIQPFLPIDRGKKLNTFCPPNRRDDLSLDFCPHPSSIFSTCFSGVSVPVVGDPALHQGAEGAVRVQREPLHLHDHLQRVPSLHLPQRVNVRGDCWGVTGSISAILPKYDFSCVNISKRRAAAFKVRSMKLKSWKIFLIHDLSHFLIYKRCTIF